MCTPTSRSKSEHWPAPSHWTANLAATARQTRSSDSWMDCEYVVAPPVASATARLGVGGTNQRVAGSESQGAAPWRREPRSPVDPLLVESWIRESNGRDAPARTGRPRRGRADDHRLAPVA